MHTIENIPFSGVYWWSDGQNVIEPLKEVLERILAETRIDTIKISGTDFNDGRQSRSIEIQVDTFLKKIFITKKYS